MLGYAFRIPPFSNYVVLAQFGPNSRKRYVRISTPEQCSAVMIALFGSHSDNMDDVRAAVWAIGRRGDFIHGDNAGLEALFDETS